MYCLFKDDLSVMGGIIDTKTQNYTFLRMCKVLEKLGIENRYFFLYLSQPELQGLDPHNLQDTSNELRMKIIYETKTNFWYFVREVIRVPSAGGDPVRYILNRSNLAMNWCFLNSVNFFSTQPRQTGKTMGTACINSWGYEFGYRNSTIGLFAKDGSLVLENVAQIKAIRRGLPSWMIDECPADTDNKEGLSYAALNNTYKTFIARQDEISAKKMGRGEKLVVQHWDEMAFFKHNDLSYPSATAASDAAQAQVRSLGLPACNIITTTAGRLSEPAGAYAFSIKQGCQRFNEKFYDLKDRETLHELVRSSASRMFYLEYSHRQLGFTDEWLAEKMVGKTEEQILLDYKNVWLSGTGTSIIPQVILNRIVESERDPVDFTQSGSLIVSWYVDKDILKEPENKNKHYLIGLDTSDNVGRDYTTMVVVDPSDLTVVATCRCNSSNFVHVVNCVSELMVSTFPSSIIIPERNKNGSVLIDILIDIFQKHNINPFYRIYNTFIQDYCERTPSFDHIDLSDGRNRRMFGFNTTSSADSRDMLYGRVLITMLNHMASRLFDKDLADEIKSLTVRNGRVDHPTGCHDDMCIALMLCGYFAFFGKNHMLYGIPSGSVLKTVNSNGELVDEAAKDRQLAIHKRIGELRANIVSCTNSMVKASYERELRMLESQIDNTLLENTTSNVEQVRTMNGTSMSPMTAFSTFRSSFF